MTNLADTSRSTGTEADEVDVSGPRGVWQLDRRDFLRASGLVVLGATAGSAAALAVPGPPTLRFGMVTDLHYADADPVGTRFYRESRAKLAECIDRMKAGKIDFLIEIGDFKDQGRPARESQTLGFLATIEADFRKFPGPVYHVAGNHDFDSISLEGYRGAIRNAGKTPERLWYSFDARGLHFVVLDCNYKSNGAHYDRGKFDWTDANVPAPELEWLEADLRAAEKPTIVFSHQLLDGEGSVFVNNAGPVRRVLEGAPCVLAAFHGHHHGGRYSHINGIHYYTLKALVEGSGPENNSYAVVDVLPGNDIVVSGYRKAVSKSLPYSRGPYKTPREP